MLTLREFIDYITDERIVVTEYGSPEVLFDGYADETPRFLYNSVVTHIGATSFDDGEPKIHILLGGN